LVPSLTALMTTFYCLTALEAFASVAQCLSRLRLNFF
jgi:hypothetical protein